MPKYQRVTIKQVAQKAGVSTQTVSRVINERPDVAPETRQRVKEVIEQLGYQPSALARSLIRQRSFTIGVVTAGLKFIGPSRTLNGITAQTEEIGYTLLLKEMPGFDTNDVQPLIDALLSRQVDGIIWAVPEVGDNRDWLHEKLPNLQVPMIFLTMETRPGISIVSVDNYAGARLAMDHLLELGYGHIGHISGPLDWWEARQRKKAWQDALSEAGILHSEDHTIEGTWSSASGERSARQLLEQYPKMDAVFVANDQMALGALQVSCREGIQVPQELAVAGFDGISEAAYFSPPLTTVLQDQHALGRTAVHELVQIIEGHLQDSSDVSSVEILQPELIVRESTLR